jgi:hypothetical protein
VVQSDTEPSADAGGGRQVLLFMQQLGLPVARRARNLVSFSQ